MNSDNASPDPSSADRIANFFFFLTVVTCLVFAGYVVHKVF